MLKLNSVLQHQGEKWHDPTNTHLDQCPTKINVPTQVSQGYLKKKDYKSQHWVNFSSLP